MSQFGSWFRNRKKLFDSMHQLDFATQVWFHDFFSERGFHPPPLLLLPELHNTELWNNIEPWLLTKQSNWHLWFISLKKVKKIGMSCQTMFCFLFWVKISLDMWYFWRELHMFDICSTNGTIIFNQFFDDCILSNRSLNLF